MTEATKKLTEEQERIVWQHICGRITDDDRNPEEVIRENYKGDRSRYLRDMADWHGIRFDKTETA